MVKRKQVTLPQLDAGQNGRVIDINGGQGVVSKLAALGIRPGQNVMKKNSVFPKGPVVIRINSSEVAIGYGMASKVHVEVDA